MAGSAAPRVPGIGWALALAVMVTQPLGAQPVAAARWPSAVPQEASPSSFDGLPVLASAILPGSGQAMRGHYGWAAAFLAAEVGSWWWALDSRAEGHRLRDDYRDLAWSVARGRPEPRVDGPFEYYERLVHWQRSGAWDADPGTPALDPERAPDAFNGRQWRLAADIFLEGRIDALPGSPGYEAALAWYRDRAYGEELLWDWTGRSDARDRFASLIEDSDSALRRASIGVGLVVANHVLSAAEAFVRARLAGPAVELDLVPPSSRALGGPALRIRVPLSN